jgi:FMN phosphatase YigB (HAD superfamily)
MKGKPVLFLDFDRTLFSTERFYEWLGESRMERIIGIVSGDIAAPDFAAMLYVDAIDFLTRMRGGYRLVVLTFDANEGLQRKKLQGSGITGLVDDIIITQGDKGEEAKRYLERIGAYPKGHAFIDDRPEYLFAMRAAAPGVATILIRRDGDFASIGDLPEGKVDALVRDLAEAERFLVLE